MTTSKHSGRGVSRRVWGRRGREGEGESMKESTVNAIHSKTAVSVLPFMVNPMAHNCHEISGVSPRPSVQRYVHAPIGLCFKQFLHLQMTDTRQ
jgi:hypothetical protein